MFQYFLTIFLLAASSLALADQKYNPHTGSWETTDSDSTLQYNPHENSWEYADPDASARYNAFENIWELSTAEEELRYIPHENSWEYTSPKSTTEYNPYEDRWEFAEPGEELEYNAYENEWEYPQSQACQYARQLVFEEMEIKDYYLNDFRSDLAHFMPDKRLPYFGHSWNYDCGNLKKVPSERRAVFLICLYFTVLMDQAMHSHYPSHYSRFEELTRYPKFCHGLGQFQKNPRAILSVPADICWMA